VSQLAWIHEMLHRHVPRAVLSFEQGLTFLFEYHFKCCFPTFGFIFLQKPIRLAAVEMLIKSAPEMAQIKVISLATLNRILFESTLESKVALSSERQSP